MLRSMTAFARHTMADPMGIATWELRSVNHRYLEISCRLPEDLRALEPLIRQRVTTVITRGKLECTLRFVDNPAAEGPLLLNRAFVQQLVEATRWVKTMSGMGTLNLLDILRWPGVVMMDSAAVKDEQRLMVAYDQALLQLVAVRTNEGSALQPLLEQRLTSLEQQIDRIQQRLPEIGQLQRQKLQDKLLQASLPLELAPDPEHLASALLVLIQRLDVTEELERLALHVQETRSILQQPDAVGRRLDFMMQELGREANTLAAKATLPEVTLAAVEMKLLIEQMREQIQNIE
jgi:uncharacterized protein (TIGR00255 family)